MVPTHLVWRVGNIAKSLEDVFGDGSLFEEFKQSIGHQSAFQVGRLFTLISISGLGHGRQQDFHGLGQKVHHFLVIRQAHGTNERFAKELVLGRFQVALQALLPLFPGPLELEVAEMVGEPGGKELDTGGLHVIEALENKLGGLSKLDRMTKIDKIGTVGSAAESVVQ